MEEQMHKQFYCKVDKQMMMFVNHTTEKKKWICTSCNFVTTKPITNPKLPETQPRSSMDSFWERMAQKSRGEYPVGIRSC